MKATDLYEFDGRYDPDINQKHALHVSDTNHPKVTLALLNRLKKIKAKKKLELLKQSDFYQVIYGQSSGEESGGSPF